MAGLISGPSFREVLKHTTNYDLDAAGLKIVLLRSDFVPDPDFQFVSSISAFECTATGYTGGFGGAGRKAISGNALTYDTGTNILKFDADNPAAWTPLGTAGVGVNNTLGYGAIIREVTNDAASILFCTVKLATPYLTTGSNFTIEFNASGIFTKQF